MIPMSSLLGRLRYCGIVLMWLDAANSLAEAKISANDTRSIPPPSGIQLRYGWLPYPGIREDEPKNC